MRTLQHTHFKHYLFFADHHESQCEFYIWKKNRRNQIYKEQWYEHTSLNTSTLLFEYKHTPLRIQAHPRTFFFSEEVSARTYLDQNVINLDSTKRHLVCFTSLEKIFIFQSFKHLRRRTQCLYYLHQTNKSLNSWKISYFELMSMPRRRIML
jgi:hypothetical protein